MLGPGRSCELWELGSPRAPVGGAGPVCDPGCEKMSAEKRKVRGAAAWGAAACPLWGGGAAATPPQRRGAAGSERALLTRRRPLPPSGRAARLPFPPAAYFRGLT